MSEKLLAALKVGPATTELREFDLPDVPPDAALHEGGGGGRLRHRRQPVQAAAARRAAHHGARERRHPCEGRAACSPSTRDSRKAISCSSSITSRAATASGTTWASTATARRRNGSTTRTAIRYGYTSLDIPPGLWGGFSHYVYLPLNAVLHRVPARPVAGGGGTRDADVERHPVDAARRRRRLRVDGADSGAGPAGDVLRDGREAGGRRSHHRHRHVERTRGGSRWRRRSAPTRSSTCRRTMRSSGRWRSRAAAASTSSSIAHRAPVEAAVLLGIEATKRRGGTMVVQGRGERDVSRFPDRPAHEERDDAEERARPFVSRRGAWRCSAGVAPVPARTDDDAPLRAGRGRLRDQVGRRRGRAGRHSRLRNAVEVDAVDARGSRGGEPHSRRPGRVRRGGARLDAAPRAIPNGS